jgi:hypothetical protein
MHLSEEQFLAVRDGEAPAADVAHASACPDCAAEVARLAKLRDSLAALPVERPQRDLWPATHSRVVAERSRRRLARAGWLVAAMAAMVTLVVGVQGGLEAWREAKTAREVKTLIGQSQRLERALRSVDGGGRVVSGRAAGTIVDLEDHIASIDAQLGRKGAESLTSPELVTLWQERVRLLDALVNVEATRVAYVGL